MIFPLTEFWFWFFFSPPASGASGGSVRCRAGSPLSAGGFSPGSPRRAPRSSVRNGSVPKHGGCALLFRRTEEKKRRENPGIMADLQMFFNWFDSMTLGTLFFCFCLCLFLSFGGEFGCSRHARGPSGSLLMESRVFIEGGHALMSFLQQKAFSECVPVYSPPLYPAYSQ